jgi:hypothetical protein
MGGSHSSLSLAIVVIAAVSSPANDAQVLMQRDVSLRMALTIAETAIAECEKSGNNVLRGGSRPRGTMAGIFAG